MNAPQKKPNRGKNGGRVHFVASRVSLEERARFDLNARNAGLSIGSYLRACGLGSAGPRARRSPPVNAQLLAYAVAQLNRVGNNLNQLNKRQNAAQATGADESTAAVAETRAAIRLICESLGQKERA
jgi:hypothetical protein